ncbi:MAG TPA: hypothetical protein VJ746_06060 [Nitrospira sp.]|nr:hypothetical protein [Nitrospira sp.]
MARVRAERTRSKGAILEDLALGMERLQSLIPQIEDLGRDGFPYLEGARARTELQLKECIRKVFGEKSPEYDSYRKHRVSVETPADTKQTVAFIKSLLAALEDRKLEIQGLKPTPPTPVEPPPAPVQRAQLALVPPAVPTAQVTISPATPVTPPPLTMAVALTTNVDLAQSSAVSTIKSSSAPINQSPTHETVLPQTTSTASPSSGASQPSVEPPPVTPVQAVSTAEQEARSTTWGSVSKIATHGQHLRSSDTHKAVIPEEPSGIVSPPASSLTGHPSSEKHGTVPMATPSNRQPSPTSGTASQFSPSDSLEIVKALCTRFHLVARQLRLRGEYRATLDVEDEFDVQDLIHALLRLHFDDIETTEWVPGYANGAPRIIFLLNDGRLAVAVKKTRTGLNAKDLAEQLRVDIEYCRTLKRCSTLLCFVYDPEGRIGNPRGLEADLMSISDQLTADVYVAPK